MKLYNYLFDFVVLTSKLYKIDESHAVKHSMDVFYYSNEIYKNELINNPYIKEHKNIIDSASILHDMCDKKYMNEKRGLERIGNYLKDKLTKNETDMTLKIISTMSYSKVKKHGFPNLEEYQLAYNIVREADLLAGYDFDRCIIYQMLKNNECYETSFLDAKDLFQKRTLKYREDNLFITEYSKKISNVLHQNAIERINFLSDILDL
jgi:HD superfamily phosphodiesterase